MPGRVRPRRSENREVMGTMEVGDMIEWEGVNVTGWYRVAKECGVKIGVRKLGEGLWGIWRVG